MNTKTHIKDGVIWFIGFFLIYQGLSPLFSKFGNKNQNKIQSSNFEVNGINYDVIIIDSCEYLNNISYRFFTHKGNCKYCAKRTK
jgi:hypothetical protein